MEQEDNQEQTEQTDDVESNTENEDAEPNEETREEESSEQALDLPDCIQEFTESSEIEYPWQIKSQTVNNEVHYWINTWANASDGDEFIVNDQCDTVCYYGGWINPECIENYSNEDWETIWEN